MEVLSFIKEHYRAVYGSFRGNSQVSCLHANENSGFSCYYVHLLLLSLFTFRNKEQRDKNILSQKYDSTTFPGLEDWCIYEFNVTNHHFTIIYIGNEIYYVDYYMEPRGADSPDVFCVKRLTYKEWDDFYSACVNYDYDKLAKFYGGDDYFYQDLVESRQAVINVGWEDVYIEEITKTKIENNFVPTVDDLMLLCFFYAPEHPSVYKMDYSDIELDCKKIIRSELELHSAYLKYNLKRNK